MRAAGYHAGASVLKITPPVGLLLVGPVGPSTGVHDDLFARTLVLGDGNTTVALVCLDLIGLDFATSEAIRAEARRRTGIQTVLVSCTHTHSAPFTVPWSVVGWTSFQAEGRQWRADLPGRIADAVSHAATRMRRAVLRAGRAPVQVGINRRLSTEAGVVMTPNPAGPVAPWTDILRVDSTTGEPFAVLASHSAHPVIVHASSTLMSSDYPGYALETIRRRLGSGVEALFSQGCGANINGEPLRGGFEAAERAGRLLGEAAVKAAVESLPIEAKELRVRSATLSLGLRPLPALADCERSLQEAEERLAEAESRQSEADADRSPARMEELWFLRDAVLCLKDLRAKVLRREKQEVQFAATSVRLGTDWCLLAMSHEAFCEYQLWADSASSSRRTMTLAYTDGCETYLPTDEDFALGGYEAASFPVLEAALRYPYRVALREGTEREVKAALRGLLA